MECDAEKMFSWLSKKRPKFNKMRAKLQPCAEGISFPTPASAMYFIGCAALYALEHKELAEAKKNLKSMLEIAEGE